MGADIALFPEMWSCGYRIYDRPREEWIRGSHSGGWGVCGSLSRSGASLRMAIGVTLLEACETGRKNSLLLFDRNGQKVLSYAKVHTCDFDVERALTPGDDFYVADLDTEAGVVKVGAMICYDREFPESARILMLKARRSC